MTRNKQVFFQQPSSPETETQMDPYSSYTNRHIMVVTNFDPGTVYQFQVESTDGGGNTGRSKTITLLTPRKEQSVFQVIMSNVEEMFSWVGKVR